MSFIIIILSVVIIVLLILLSKKKTNDKHELEQYTQTLETMRQEYDKITQKCEFQIQRTHDAEERYNSVIQQYKVATAQNQEDLDNFFSQQRKFRQSELDTEFDEKKRQQEENLKLDYSIKKQTYDSALLEEQEKIQATLTAAKTNEAAIIAEVEYQQKKFDSILETLRQYEREAQEKLFYTIQIPDEFKDDINFLLNDVSQKVRHPDIINKLVWAEYIKKYLDETIKRVGIEDKAGIYKITNIIDGKSYIGKSTNIKKRLQDHFKSSVGITGIADQAVHHAILKQGIWNWAIEPVIYCEKEQLNELEKYYIDFFKSQTYGYNKNTGGGG